MNQFTGYHHRRLLTIWSRLLELSTGCGKLPQCRMRGKAAYLRAKISTQTGYIAIGPTTNFQLSLQPNSPTSGPRTTFIRTTFSERTLLDTSYYITTQASTSISISSADCRSTKSFPISATTSTLCRWLPAMFFSPKPNHPALFPISSPFAEVKIRSCVT